MSFFEYLITAILICSLIAFFFRSSQYKKLKALKNELEASLKEEQDFNSKDLHVERHYVTPVQIKSEFIMKNDVLKILCTAYDKPEQHVLRKEAATRAAAYIRELIEKDVNNELGLLFIRNNKESYYKNEQHIVFTINLSPIKNKEAYLYRNGKEI